MNLIRCSLDCKFQKDGYCNLDNSFGCFSSNKNCSFYSGKKKAKNKEQRN